MRALYRVLVYALVTAIVEGSSIIVLYSSGYPNNWSAMGSLAYLIFYNVVIWFLLGRGSPIATPEEPWSWINNPSFQVVVGVVGMFAIVSVIGEVILWLRQEISEATGETERVT